MRWREKSSQRKLQLFWAGMDAMFILIYVQGSLRRGNVPYLTDVRNMMGLAKNHSEFAEVVATISLVSHTSIIITCVLFFLGWRIVYYLAFAQIPFRLLFLMPSFSTILLWPRVIPDLLPSVLLILIVGSEIVKGWSLWWLCRVKGHRGE